VQGGFNDQRDSLVRQGGCDPQPQDNCSGAAAHTLTSWTAVWAGVCGRGPDKVNGPALSDSCGTHENCIDKKKRPPSYGVPSYIQAQHSTAQDQQSRQLQAGGGALRASAGQVYQAAAEPCEAA